MDKDDQCASSDNKPAVLRTDQFICRNYMWLDKIDKKYHAFRSVGESVCYQLFVVIIFIDVIFFERSFSL